MWCVVYSIPATLAYGIWYTVYQPGWHVVSGIQYKVPGMPIEGGAGASRPVTSFGRGREVLEIHPLRKIGIQVDEMVVPKINREQNPTVPSEARVSCQYHESENPGPRPFMIALGVGDCASTRPSTAAGSSLWPVSTVTSCYIALITGIKSSILYLNNGFW
jgi:hypothetical protein